MGGSGGARDRIEGLVGASGRSYPTLRRPNHPCCDYICRVKCEAFRVCAEGKEPAGPSGRSCPILRRPSRTRSAEAGTSGCCSAIARVYIARKAGRGAEGLAADSAGAMPCSPMPVTIGGCASGVRTVADVRPAPAFFADLVAEIEELDGTSGGPCPVMRRLNRPQLLALFMAATGRYPLPCGIW